MEISRPLCYISSNLVCYNEAINIIELEVFVATSTTMLLRNVLCGFWGLQQYVAIVGEYLLPPQENPEYSAQKPVYLEFLISLASLQIFSHKAAKLGHLHDLLSDSYGCECSCQDFIRADTWLPLSRRGIPAFSAQIPMYLWIFVLASIFSEISGKAESWFTWSSSGM